MKVKIRIEKLTESEKGYLAGMYIGDGNLFICRKRGIRWYLSFTEKNIEEHLIKILSKLNLNVRRYKGKDNTKHNLHS